MAGRPVGHFFRRRVALRCASTTIAASSPQPRPISRHEVLLPRRLHRRLAPPPPHLSDGVDRTVAPSCGKQHACRHQPLWFRVEGL